MREVTLDTLYGQFPAYQDDSGFWRVPVNSVEAWAKAVLTPEDWQKLEEEGEHTLSVCTVTVKPEEHPEGADRGGYVLTATFHNVGYYKLQEGVPAPDKLWSHECSLYYDEGDCEWRS